MASAPRSLNAWSNNFEPFVSQCPTPKVRLQHQTVWVLTPNRCLRAAADSVRIARTSSSVTSRPEPPPWVPGRQQRGQAIGAAVQDVTVTSVSRQKHVARSPRRRCGGVYGPASRRGGGGFRGMGEKTFRYP